MKTINNNFPKIGCCVTDNKTIIDFISAEKQPYMSDAVIPVKNRKGIAWNYTNWWYFSKTSNMPEIKEQDVLKFINKDMEESLTGTIDGSTSSITTTTINPMDYRSEVIYAASWTHTNLNLVINNIKLRVKCRNLKKNLKMPLMQMSL